MAVDRCLHQISLSILQLIATLAQVFSDCIRPPRKQLVQLATFPPAGPACHLFIVCVATYLWVGSYTYNETITLMHQSVVLGQLLRLSRVARLSWGLATLEYDRLVVSSPIKNIDFRFGRPFPFPRFRVFQLPVKWSHI